MANQFSVTPLGGLDVGTKMTSIIEGGRKQHRIKQMREKAPEIFATGDPTQIANFMVEYPEMATTMEKATGVEDAGHKGEIVDMAKGLLTPGADPKEVIAQYANTLQQSGRDPKMAVSMLSKIMADPAQGIDMGEKLLSMHSSNEFLAYKKATAPTAMPGAAEINVRSSEILEDGTIIQSTDTGPVVYGPEGTLLKGKDAAGAIKRARAEKVSNIRKGAGGKKTASLEAEMELKGKVAAGVIGAEEAAKISVKAFDRLEKINTNIKNIDEAISLIDQGAETGVIDAMLPSVRAASIKLDNLQGRLGLDVIGNTTFGALSESELKFALKTALPLGLSPKDLRQWLIDKKSAQEKLSDYIESAAIYLGTPGNTVTGWIKSRKEKQSVPTPPPGGVTDIPEITSQMDFDNLESGAIYTEDGKQYRKP